MAERTPVRPGTIVAVAVAVLALGGLQGSTAGAQTVAAVPAATTTCDGTRPEGSFPERADTVDDTPLQRTLTRLEKLATGRHADAYAGLVVDEDTASADLYRIPSAAFDKAACDAAERGVTLRIHDHDINERDLTVLLDRISEDMTRWDGTFDLREVGLDGTGRIVIGVDDPATAEPILRAAFGEHNAKYLVVEYAPQAHLL
ncbi:MULTISPECIES: hypothetical protein [Streptomyces]|uniref:Putative secreted protein n=1 Tax=Streptomyces scabiei (strain 87.22) TaxID=680198 RepID=C9Z7A3_STRSW|nr:hypothetical protein [Streptomyces scabiei]KFG10233.1 hypothetical protein IQ61_03835 [Streptomyces scabiei]MDX2578211.1 hypothetical protein [Streptomyces scabiei]MDX2657523.1 hypothetical protein [Streptomyces scabiei]MDX2723825.1 hypothetical protein [Streptomyces scabiei]MDX2831470.1 hypothetical protein [Streptomyces scabiei]